MRKKHFWGFFEKLLSMKQLKKKGYCDKNAYFCSQNGWKAKTKAKILVKVVTEIL